MLYTRKGDSGTTKAFDSKPGQRMSKSSCRTEALGALDELNSYIGLVKVRAADISWPVNVSASETISLAAVMQWTQECLFITQAEVAGADKKISQDKVTRAESIIDAAEHSMPPITTFFISGGTEIAALLDISRTLARKAERRVIAGTEVGECTVGPVTLAYLNRLSSLFYALARYANFQAGIKEVSPEYK